MALSMKKILIAEDEPDVRENLTDLLFAEGYFVRAAVDGQQCVDMAMSEPPDLLICDLVMPNMDGFQVVNRLRSEDFTADIPIIMLTARGARSDYRLAMEAGADDYITKPFHAGELLAAIESRLHRLDLQRKHFLDSLNLVNSHSGPNSLREAMQNAYSVCNFSSMLNSHSAALGPSSVLLISKEIQDCANRVSTLLEDFAVRSCVEAESASLLDSLDGYTGSTNFDQIATALQAFSLQWGRSSDLDLSQLQGNFDLPPILMKKLCESMLEAIFMISLPGDCIRIRVEDANPLTMLWSWQPHTHSAAQLGLTLGQSKLNYASKISALMGLHLQGSLQDNQLILIEDQPESA